MIPPGLFTVVVLDRPLRQLGGAQLYISAYLYVLARTATVGPMSEMSLSDARARLADVVDRARVEHDPVYLTRRGRRVAAVVDAGHLEQLIEASEDLADLQAAAAARAEIAEPDKAPIPWEQVKADLGMA